MVSYYKKQVEVARQFGVSEATITNWIKNAGQGSNNIQITEIDGSRYIIKNEHNRVEMEKMAQNARKYRSDESEKDVVASSEIYEIMEENQLVSLINSIAIRKEIRLKYSFLGKGAQYWQEFCERTVEDDTYKGASNDVALLEKLFTYLEWFTAGYDHFNIIDLGSGDASPLIEFIRKAIKTKKLKNYVAVDISKKNLEITEKNIIRFFNKSLYIPCHLDFEVSSLEDILYKYKTFDGKRNKVRNIIFFIGSTIGNMGGINQQVKVLQNIRDGMGPDDLLIISNAYDNIYNRTYFPKFLVKDGDQQELYIPNLLGISEDDFSKEFKYNDLKDLREYNLVLNKNVNIKFEKIELSIELKKGDSINIWKHRRDTFEFISEKMDRAGLALEFVVKHPTNTQIMYMATVAE